MMAASRKVLHPTLHLPAQRGYIRRAENQWNNCCGSHKQVKMKGLFSFTLGLILVSVGSSKKVNPKVECSYPGETISDIYDCHWYWYCNPANEPEHHECPTGSDWDAIDMNCYPPPVTCAGTGTPAPPTTPSPNEYVCSYPSQIVPQEFACDGYFICDYTLVSPTFYRCDAGYYYDPSYGSCNLASRVTCSGGYRPSPLPTAIPVSSSPPPNVYNACAVGYPGLLVPDPTLCDYWWKCNSGRIAELFTCAPGLLFDHVAPMRCTATPISCI